jgi:prolyl oligopeptidase
MRRLLASTFVGFSVLFSTFAGAEPLRKDDVVDDYHGTKVADPFRWLEAPDAAETRAFIDARNQVTRSFLDSPLREEIHDRLKGLINYPRQSMPARYGDKLFFSTNTGLQQQSVVMMQTGIDGKPSVLIDPNTLSADGTVALSGMTYTDDGSLVAYGVSVGGSDQKTVRVRDLATNTDLPDVLENMRFAGIGWLGNRGFYFNRYPAPGSVPAEQERLNNKLFYHALGGDVKNPKLIYERPDKPEISLYGGVTRDQQWLFVYESVGTDQRSGLLVRDASPDSTDAFKRIVEPGVASVGVIENDGNTAYAMVDLDAPKRKVVAIDLQNPTPANWKTIIPEFEKDVIESVDLVNEQFVLTVKRDAASVILLYTKEGQLLGQVPLPTVGSAWVGGRREDKTLFVGFTSYTYPTTLYVYDFESKQLTPFFTPKVDFKPDEFVTEQLFYPSKDGTRIPLFVTRKKDLKLDGTNPTVLYGYGGFSAGMSPGFSAIQVAWLERGGVFAVACIRGGDEYGNAWHEAGKLDRKQTVFDDFIAAGEFLVAQKYTSPQHLAIEGGSNGGLLVAACMLQRPELFGAVICQVGVLDMLRYHQFGTGRFWTVEYGNAQADEKQFKTLLAYSPLHNVKPGATYPPILITTGDGDDRVVPAHSLKFAAQLIDQANPKNLVLLRYETKAGHGGGKPLGKVLEESADEQAFLWKTLK